MAYTQSIGFGSGFMYFTPQVAAGIVAQPVRIGVMQDVSLDFSFDEKPLYGQNQFPVAVARGRAKLSCKTAFAQIDSGVVGTIFLQGQRTAGEDVVVDLEAHTLSSTTGQVITNSGAISDLGVFYQATGQPLQATTSGSETTAWYSVNLATGRYQVSTSDSAAALYFSYKWNSASVGYKSTIASQPMGSFTPFQTDLFQQNPVTTPSTQWGARLYKCMSNKLMLATKQDDWSIPAFDFAVFANAAGNVLDFNSPDH